MALQLVEVLKVLSQLEELWQKDHANEGKPFEPDEDGKTALNRMFEFLVGDSLRTAQESPDNQQVEEPPQDGQPTVGDYDDLLAELEIADAAKEDLEKTMEMVEDRFAEKVRRCIQLERERQDMRLQLEELSWVLRNKGPEPASDDETSYEQERRAHEMLRATLGSLENQCDQTLKRTHGNGVHQTRALRQTLQSVRDKLRNLAL